MQGLSAKLNKIRAAIKKQELEDKKARECIKEILAHVSGAEDLVKEISLTKNNIVLKARNKTCEQELFLLREQIMQELGKHQDYLEYNLTVR